MVLGASSLINVFEKSIAEFETYGDSSDPERLFNFVFSFSINEELCL